MNVEKLIIDEENNFFNSEAREAKFLILRPEALEELKFQLYPEHSFEELLNVNILSYAGLQIAITFNETAPPVTVC